MQAYLLARTVLRVLEDRFGSVPIDLVVRVWSSTDLDQLGSWLGDALDANSLAHFRERVYTSAVICEHPGERRG